MKEKDFKKLPIEKKYTIIRAPLEASIKEMKKTGKPIFVPVPERFIKK